MKENIKLNLRNDYVFKMMHYIDEEKGKKIFASMIHAFAGIEVQDVSFQPTELYPMDVNGKDVRFDLCASVNTKTNVDVEMQVFHMREIAERIAYNTAILFTSRNNKGQSYSRLEQATSIALCENHVFPNQPRYTHTFCFTEVETGLLLTEKMKTHIIEMKKGIHQIKQTRRFHDLSMKDKWIYFLMKYEDGTEDTGVRALIENNEVFSMVKEVLQMISQDELARQRAIAREIHLRDEAQRKYEEEQMEARMAEIEAKLTTSEAELAKKQALLAEKQAVLEEKQAVLEEKQAELAEKQVELVEIKERNKQMILSMIQKGFSDELITELTGCTLEYIESLKG